MCITRWRMAIREACILCDSDRLSLTTLWSGSSESFSQLGLDFCFYKYIFVSPSVVGKNPAELIWTALFSDQDLHLPPSSIWCLINLACFCKNSVWSVKPEPYPSTKFSLSNFLAPWAIHFQFFLAFIRSWTQSLSPTAKLHCRSHHE